MMYATVYMGKETMEQEIPKKVDNLQKFSTEIKWEKRSEILKKINDEVKNKLNALSVNTNAANVCASVNAKVTESKKWLLKKWWLKSLLRDEHYIHVKGDELQITDDLKWEKPAKEGVDLDNRQHRGLVAWFLTGLIMADVSVKNNIDFLQLMDYIDALDKLESEFSQTMETETTLTKKETRKLRKTLRKDINLDKKEGEFDPLLTEYRKWVTAQSEAVQNAANEIASVSKNIKDVWLNDSGYTISWAVKKIDDTTFSSNIEKNNVVINDVKFDKDGKAIAGDYSGTKNSVAQQYAVTVDTDGKLIATEKTTDAPAPWIDKPKDDSFVEITVENDKKPILDLLTWVTITDWKLYKSPATWNIAFYKITWKADGADFTLYLDKDKKLQSEDSGKLTPAWEELVEVGDYAFTQATDNKISVAKKADEEGAPEMPEDLSTRTIDQIKEASSEAIVGRLWELIEKLASNNISYIPWWRWPRTNNPDIAWIQKWLIEYAKKNTEFSIRDSGNRDWRKWSADWAEFKFTWGSAPDWFIEDDFVSWEYDKWFAWSVASFQTLDESAWKQDWLPWKKTLTALQGALSPEAVAWGW